jgi:hypothetical protein
LLGETTASNSWTRTEREQTVASVCNKLALLGGTKQRNAGMPPRPLAMNLQSVGFSAEGWLQKLAVHTSLPRPPITADTIHMVISHVVAVSVVTAPVPTATSRAFNYLEPDALSSFQRLPSTHGTPQQNDNTCPTENCIVSTYACSKGPRSDRRARCG